MFRSEGVLGAAGEFAVHFTADPGVGGGVTLLGFGELFGLPVGKLLGLGYLYAKYDGSHFLDALVTDAVLPYLGLEVQEAAGLEIGDFPEAADVIGSSGAHLQDGRARKDCAQGLGHADFLKPEEEGPFGPGELQEGGSVGVLVRREGGTGFGVETYHLLTAEVADGIGKNLAGRIHNHDFPAKRGKGKRSYLLGTNRNPVHMPAARNMLLLQL